MKTHENQVNHADKMRMGKMQASVNDAVKWIDAVSLKGREDQFTSIQVKTDNVLESWRFSLFAHEWLDEEGRIKPLQNMLERERQKREAVLEMLKAGLPIERPILGLGLHEDVEIGAGRAVFLTLAAEGYRLLPVSIPKSCLEEFEGYLA